MRANPHRQRQPFWLLHGVELHGCAVSSSSASSRLLRAISSSVVRPYDLAMLAYRPDRNDSKSARMRASSTWMIDVGSLIARLSYSHARATLHEHGRRKIAELQVSRNSMTPQPPVSFALRRPTIPVRPAEPDPRRAEMPTDEHARQRLLPVPRATSHGLAISRNSTIFSASRSRSA